MNPNPPLISLQNVIKTYVMGQSKHVVLNRMSLAINQGDMVAIVGASGSGKSTLMNIIGLLDKPDSGQYLLQGQDVALLHSDDLATLRNQRIGFVFQQFNLLSRFTAEQNVALPLTYQNLPADLIKHRVQEALTRVGMLPFKSHRPSQLSGGQQQRVAIARALITEPDVLLADEPTGALDSMMSQEIMQLFLSWHAEGRTIILVTHGEHIAAQCKRRITLADGHIIAESAEP